MQKAGAEAELFVGFGSGVVLVTDAVSPVTPSDPRSLQIIMTLVSPGEIDPIEHATRAFPPNWH